jgi:HNH endonuclease
MYARIHGLAVLRSDMSADLFGRPNVRWINVCLRLPDDSSGALPLLRGVILKEDKSPTYKLGLLRAVARIADAAAGLGIPRADEDVIDIPLGLVALNLLRMYLSLVLAKLPQAPGNSGPDGLSFAKAGAAQDLRVGARFTGERAQAVTRALVEARRTITDMPANYVRLPNSDARIFAAAPKTPLRVRGELMLDGEFLSSFGNLTVPGHIWRTLQRMGSWIEPVLIGEWARLVCNYGERMRRAVNLSEVETALAWLDPVRDTNLARAVARRLIDNGHRISCVWTGTRLGVGGAVLDIDHCLPWSAWPCGDLWNLLPASRRVNQHLKRHRLPSTSVLAAARERIVAWWEIAWRSDPALGMRFDRESAAALPIHEGAASEDVFAALEWRRFRLSLDRQVPRTIAPHGRVEAVGQLPRWASGLRLEKI